MGLHEHITNAHVRMHGYYNAILSANTGGGDRVIDYIRYFPSYLAI